MVESLPLRALFERADLLIRPSYSGQKEKPVHRRDQRFESGFLQQRVERTTIA